MSNRSGSISDGGSPEPWLVQAARDRVAAFADHIRSADTEARVPNLEWTVADLGQHVACLPSLWLSLHHEGANFESPTNFAAFSDQARAHISDSEPEALASRIEDEFTPFLDQLAEWSGDFWLYGKAQTAALVCALIINETVIHGRDLAGVTGFAVPQHTEREAHACADATMMTAEPFVDPIKAAALPDGIYHVHFRRGNHWTWTKAGPKLTVSPGRPERADAHMSADPAMFILSGLGRVGQVRVALTGKIVTYGRRPWRFLGLGGVVADGV